MVSSTPVEFYMHKSPLSQLCEEKQFYRSRSRAEEIEGLLQVHVPGVWFCWHLKSDLQSPVGTLWVIGMFPQRSSTFSMKCTLNTIVASCFIFTLNLLLNVLWFINIITQ